MQLGIPRDAENEGRAFYSGVLGLSEVPKPATLASRSGCWFRNGAVEPHLGVEDSFQPAKKAHPTLLVQDLPALRVWLEGAGFHPVTDEPDRGVPPLLRQRYVRKPA